MNDDVTFLPPDPWKDIGVTRVVDLLQKLMKQVFQDRQQSQRMSITSGKFAFHILIEGIVCYLTLADKNYPKKLAFQYLEELHNEFVRLYGSQVETVARPYAFIKFGEFFCGSLGMSCRRSG